MAQSWPGPTNTGLGFLGQLTGSFDNGRVELFGVAGYPNEDGSDNHQRYVFSDIHDNTFRWDGSQSSDRGATWATGTVLPFARVADYPDLVTPGPDLPTYGEGLLCTDAPHHNLDGFVGVWQGTVTTPAGREPARLAGGRMLDGCAVGLAFHHPQSGFRQLAFFSYADLFGIWVELRIDNQPGTRHEYRITDEPNPTTFDQAPGLVIANRYDRFLATSTFSTDTGLARTRIEDLSEDHLVLVEDRRSSPDAAWHEERRYDLRRDM
jgi:hypothetical protein